MITLLQKVIKSEIDNLHQLQVPLAPFQRDLMHAVPQTVPFWGYQ